ncbi:DUF3899 domain-containing protein [Neobacillus sp. PS3-40]|uniref:DUF3899 domain-containing protein n=1 Tax=Neobacillus sp. PS3-40 TaxID=3070679 RepID=UPI0027E1BEE6|nr:DUF3899 domain-containing protein [Neobacillus sp. PS3-40]WML43380.1 DUF3899 domain-containing protein [Neobacillus sp. PS3-40]
MNHRLKKRLSTLAFSQIAILILSFIFYHSITLLSYINISFYITALLLLSSLLIYTIQTGFFDTVSRSFRIPLLRGQDKQKLKDITPLSEIVALDKKPLLIYGFAIGLFMVIGLVIYYI